MATPSLQTVYPSSSTSTRSTSPLDCAQLPHCDAHSLPNLLSVAPATTQKSMPVKERYRE
jgi:hypothetical protein